MPTSAEALAFYRDALGLEVDAPEEVASQQVRAHFLAAGAATLELLEATTPDSVIARYIEKRGPGLHHITLRVDDIDAALGASQAAASAGRRRAAAGRGGRAGRLHPSVGGARRAGRVESKRASPPVNLDVARFASAICSERPARRPVPARRRRDVRRRAAAAVGEAAPPDDRHRIQLAMRPLLVEGDWGRMLIDCGAGDKMGREGSATSTRSIARRTSTTRSPKSACRPTTIDIALATHLHFDHFGGATVRDGRRSRGRGFPARGICIRAAEWEDATHPHERNRASYLQDDFVPLQEAGVVDFFDGDDMIRPGVRVVRTGGHTGQHQIVFIESGGKTAVFVADLIPTTAHIQDPWVMGYDLFPMETLAFKRASSARPSTASTSIFFEHDPLVAAGYIRERGRHSGTSSRVL